MPGKIASFKGFKVIIRPAGDLLARVATGFRQPNTQVPEVPILSRRTATLPSQFAAKQAAGFRHDCQHSRLQDWPPRLPTIRRNSTPIRTNGLEIGADEHEIRTQESGGVLRLHVAPCSIYPDRQRGARIPVCRAVS